ncbi:MAG: TolC family protein [Bdellovibrionota bacterium]
MKWMIAAILLLSRATYAEDPTLEVALRTAYSKYPKLAAQKERVSVAESEVVSRATPSSPNIGVSQLNRGNSTLYATVEQKIDFPTKYFLKAKAQGFRAEAEESDYKALRLQVRSNVIATYYGLHAVQEIIDLNQQDLARLKEISRIAESKYASGRAPQHDQMKAHVAQTETEAKLIALRQEEQALQARLGYLLGAGSDFHAKLKGLELPVPDVRSEVEKLGFADAGESPRS